MSDYRLFCDGRDAMESMISRIEELIGDLEKANKDIERLEAQAEVDESTIDELRDEIENLKTPA